MSGPKINTEQPKNRNILIAPLDWGLGHATRCIPIIKHFTELGFTVILAASGKHANLLAKEFPNAELLPLPGYGLIYSRFGRLNGWKIFFQLPKILISIKRENRWLDTFLSGRQLDLVVSDCRFGLYHKNVISVLLTHQLHIKSPFGRWTERLLQKWNYKFINRFNECWIPDFEKNPGLAGELSHPSSLPLVPVKYIGGLSRFDSCVHDAPAIQYDVLVILSGPEPQRSIFEKIVMKELQKYKGKAAVVRGLPDQDKIISSGSVDTFNHLPAKELCSLMMKSEIIISRSGYTTVMDVVKLRKKAVLVPTPGQTEQEYLGKFLMQQKLCVCIEQQDFSLEKALKLAGQFEYDNMEGFDMEIYKKKIGNAGFYDWL